MVRAVLPGPLGTDTRQTTFAPDSGQPGVALLGGLDAWQSPTPIHERLQRIDERRHLPDLIPALAPLQVGTPVNGERKMTVGEIAMCEKLFKQSIDYSKVLVHREEFLPFGLQPDDCAMTPNGEMYFNPDKFREDFSSENDTQKWWFMHEMVHVWQHQLGYWVMLRGAIRIGLGYDYELVKGRKLGDYNMEAQGNLLADYYALKYLKPDVMVQYQKNGNDLALFEEILSDFFKNPADRAHLP